MRSDRLHTLGCMSELRPALTRMFGFDDFRPGQEQVVRAAVDGRDTLALMPTGSGKSLTYQLAAMLRPTPTLVLSPLIALMKDQVDKLPPEVASQSTLINSSLSPDEAAARLRGVSPALLHLDPAVAPEREKAPSGAFPMGGTGLEPVTPSLSSQSAGRGALAQTRISKGIPPLRAF